MDILAHRIANGIEDAGVCSLHDEDLGILWSFRSSTSASERQRFIKKFARRYGYRVHLSDIASAAIFKYAEVKT